MLRFAADENFNHHLIRGLLRRNPEIDLVTVQDAGLSGASDPDVLEWAARENRILLTHDVTTLSRHAYQRLHRGISMPGVVQVPQNIAPSEAIEDVLLLCEYCQDADVRGRVIHLPLK